MAQHIPTRLTPAEGRRFGLLVGTALLALGALLWWRGRPLGMTAFAGLGAVLVLAGLLVPARLGPVQRAWMRLAMMISRVTTPVFLWLVYFVVLTPTALIMRLARYRPLTRARTTATVWVPRHLGENRRSDMQRQF